MTCDTCRWFKRDWIREDAQSEYGQCLKHAPVTGIMAGVHVTLFPRVAQKDTCGDYEAGALNDAQRSRRARSFSLADG